MNSLSAPTTLLKSESVISRISKKLIKKWDPDFTKLTKSEKLRLENAENEIDNGICFSEEEVWK